MGEIIDFKQNKEGTYESTRMVIPKNTPKNVQDLHNLLVATKEDVQESFLKLGAYLMIIHDNKFFIELGYSTWQDYLDVPEVDLSRSQAYKLMAVYERWIEKYGYSPDRIKKTSIEKLYIASSQAKDDNYDEWLCKAETLSRADLKAETPGGRQLCSYIYCPKCEHKILIEPDLIVHERPE